ncbi:MAG: hypothetical protein B6I34_09515 [Anaerolineaceae bacterium 4572_32.1]|nr:MAG: hypothetical protein B6I34_09515 [Anaerolineaceae bacterium 4572_32.1]
MNAQRLVTRQEWRWVLFLSLTALVVTCLPYLLGWSLETSERLFGGCIFLADDCYSYLAKMQRAAQGEWLLQMPYTSEPHAKTLIYVFYVLLGKLVALTGLSPVAIYHVMRVLLGLGLLLTVYRFLAAFTEQIVVRRLTWLMVTFGGGLGWLLVALGQSSWLGAPPLDFYLPEGFAFLVLLGFPHLAAAQSLLLWGLLFLLKTWREYPNPKHVALTGFLWLLMGLIIPFYVPVAWAVMGAAWLALALRRKSVLWQEGLAAGAVALISAPIVAYSAWIFTHDRVYATWAAQNLILSPHPLHYLAAYGVPLVLAALAVRDAWRDEGPAWLPLAWVAVVPVLVYLPFNLQRRLVEGVQVPLSLLAAWGAARLWRSRRRWLVVALLATMLPTSLILLAGSSGWMLARPAPVFRDSAEITALDWLAERVAPDNVVLTAYDTGTYLPVRAGARAFLGHGLETVDADEKEALVVRFFDVTATDSWRQQLLEKHDVDYVFWGPSERALGDFDPAQAAYLRQIYNLRANPFSGARHSCSSCPGSEWRPRCGAAGIYRCGTHWLAAERRWRPITKRQPFTP